MIRPLAALAVLLVALAAATPADATGKGNKRIQRHHHRHSHSFFLGAGFYGPYYGFCGAACGAYFGTIYVPEIPEGSHPCAPYFLQESGGWRPMGFACKRVDGLWDMYPDPLPPSGSFGAIEPIR